MQNFLSIEEKKISKDFETKGFVIRNIKDLSLLDSIRTQILKPLKKSLNISKKITDDELLNFSHRYIKKNELNDLRLSIFNKMNLQKNFRENYYNISKEFLDLLLGNEVSMQLRVNLSIQLPHDESSLLPLHSDVWSGDSPYEIVVWLPLVNCFSTKSMFILPPNKYHKLKKLFNDKKINSTDKIFNKLRKDLIWIEIKYGQILLFNQCLPHGNVVNKTKESRWSLNCRYKGVFTPYVDKRIGEFFEPITLKKVSEMALRYKLPKINEKS
ncbi:MAG: 2OG-Fe(II) oxygenase [Candidatus Endolissoclinum sp. TMED37]|nr:MAG: 2OG-Fe(II) oxygenase [Candidatus Endolissoclinum sp. TMED37]|tara:strand:+ start:3051 stop:3860 length:810 start_codon:yes stop_codon:yes gene_type:complete